MNYAMLLARVRRAAQGTYGGWDISTAAFSQSFDVVPRESNPSGVFFRPDGLKMYTIGFAGDEVDEYDLAVAWDISTASYLQNFGVASQTDRPTEIFFKPDGLKMYVLGAFGGPVYEYNLSVAWDVSTASYLQAFSSGAGQETPQGGLFIKPDGLKMYVVGGISSDIKEFNLSVAWDVSTASYLHGFSTGGQEDYPSGIFFNPGGLKMYVVGTESDGVNEYDLAVAWDISTASYLQGFSVASQTLYPSGIFFKPDGFKMYVIDEANERRILEYNLSPV